MIFFIFVTNQMKIIERENKLKLNKDRVSKN